MFSSEIKETIYIAISLMLAAMVLTLAAYVLSIRSDLASVKNTDIATQESMENFYTFNKYQGQILYGEDVIACIREFADTDISIYIDKLYDDKNNYMTYYLDRQKYIKYPNMASIDFLEYGGTQGGVTLNGGVQRDRTYFAYLVFSEYSETDIKNASYSDMNKNMYYSDVTAIKILYVYNGREDGISNSSTSVNNAVNNTINSILNGSKK